MRNGEGGGREGGKGGDQRGRGGLGGYQKRADQRIGDRGV